ncbi:very short patch repair endonuclease [Candidatus Bathycorpusculum sp.]|uniref:very short patch repair endonuclease n=1 Tax=Candidatus Bathycorpusculum sp. TaxID=2994959 RepID=UPI0028177DA0|nr:very short patch repair endonuclease [Candidatus Termitimicrobium sp.]MCL2432473.1 very short patch repair endonuclease [Candidatus Termitimicrobium sp.]
MDNLTPEQRRKNMQHIRSKGTKAERLLIDELQQRGAKFSCYDKTVFGKPDLVFPEQKIVVFVDSDFWHCNPARFVRPKTNVEYWDKKIATNKERDHKVNQELRRQNWTIIRLWEYDVKHDLCGCVEKVLAKLDPKTAGYYE